MKQQNITIDINRLSTQDLEVLKAIVYNSGDMNTTKQINDRIAFMNGWLSEKKEKEYCEKYC